MCEISCVESIVTRDVALRWVRTVHTLVWVIFAGSIVLIPVLAYLGQFARATWLIGLVFVEVIILMLNRMRCPLTDVAGRYTSDRRDNFDIYLPEWLARQNKTIFGTLYVAGVVYAMLRWLWES